MVVFIRFHSPPIFTLTQDVKPIIRGGRRHSNNIEDDDEEDGDDDDDEDAVDMAQLASLSALRRQRL